MVWQKFTYCSKELQLKGTLNGGQSFRWTYNKNTNEWIGVFSKTVWKLRENNNCIEYKVISTLLSKEIVVIDGGKNITKKIECVDFLVLLERYFRLDVDLIRCYNLWSETDAVFQSVCEKFYGIRMLRQEPVENVFSFICSQNNNIARITSMVEKLCTHYGDKICEYEGNTYYAFPEVEKLAPLQVEQELRQLGFGYRAKFIQKSAALIVQWGGEEWLENLRNMKYEEAKFELMNLHGIGPKVADCICLMSLGFFEALPVDTHVYKIAARNYLPHLRGKRLTSNSYKEIADHFRILFGDMAGWAHTILFCADLKKLPDKDASETCTSKPVKEKE